MIAPGADLAAATAARRQAWASLPGAAGGAGNHPLASWYGAGCSYPLAPSYRNRSLMALSGWSSSYLYLPAVIMTLHSLGSVTLAQHAGTRLLPISGWLLTSYTDTAVPLHSGASGTCLFLRGSPH